MVFAESSQVQCDYSRQVIKDCESYCGLWVRCVFSAVYTDDGCSGRCWTPGRLTPLPTTTVSLSTRRTLSDRPANRPLCRSCTQQIYSTICKRAIIPHTWTDTTANLPNNPRYLGPVTILCMGSGAACVRIWP